MRIAELAVVFAIAACSPAKREPSHVIAASDDAAPASDVCPASFASGGGLCTPSGKSCEYPEGTCACAPQSYCGGAAPSPETLKQLRVPRWTCTPSPKMLGPD